MSITITLTEQQARTLVRAARAGLPEAQFTGMGDQQAAMVAVAKVADAFENWQSTRPAKRRKG